MLIANMSIIIVFLFSAIYIEISTFELLPLQLDVAVVEPLSIPQPHLCWGEFFVDLLSLLIFISITDQTRLSIEQAGDFDFFRKRKRRLFHSQIAMFMA